jgi:hypothetical protein
MPYAFGSLSSWEDSLDARILIVPPSTIALPTRIRSKNNEV